MDKGTFERQQAFAGEKKPSMLRRCVGHDYTNRRMYMITMVTEGRKPMLGRLVGNADAAANTADAPRIELTPLGKLVEQEWWKCGEHHPEIEVISLQIMPDHLHGILFVREKIEKPLGMALRGFKQSCNKHYRRLALGEEVGCVALATQHTEPGQEIGFVALATQHTEPVGPKTEPAKRDRRGEDRSHGLLFARGYNDKLLLREGQLDRWKNYLKDNPQRLAIRRAHPDLFRVRFGLSIAGQTYAAIGNQFLLQHPVKVQVQLSRRLTEAEVQAQVAHFLNLAQQGAVLVSPAISKGEQAVMRAALDAHFPLIFLTPWGFNTFSKPGHQYYQACTEGRFLILAPWEHLNERIPLTRDMCLSLNNMTKIISEQ